MTKRKNNDVSWTESSIKNFRYYVASDFIDQLQSSFEQLDIKQRNFAEKLGLTEGRVSQVFNDPGNLTLDTMIKWGRAAGLKTGIVLYNDSDTKNIRGPLTGSIFVECWKAAGSPLDLSNIQPHTFTPQIYEGAIQDVKKYEPKSQDKTGEGLSVLSKRFGDQSASIRQESQKEI